MDTSLVPRATPLPITYAWVKYWNAPMAPTIR
jgi:hypothetical protein